MLKRALVLLAAEDGDPAAVTAAEVRVHPTAVPRPPLLVVPPTPLHPPPLRPHPDRFVPVPIIPEADPALLVAGLLVVGGLVAWRPRRVA